MDFFKMYEEVRDFESNYKKEHENKEVPSPEHTDRTEETEVTEETKEEGNEERNLITEEKEIENESEDN